MGNEHHHHHKTDNIRAAFFINLCFAAVEMVGGFLTNSVAILSDALHDLGDSFSLGIAWYLQHQSGKPGDKVYTYGYKRFSVLGAVITSIILIIGSLFIIQEAAERILHPQPADARGMILLAMLGLVFNGIALLRLRKGKSINERVVSLHFLEDVLGWIAVLIGAVVMYFFEVPVLDPLLSLGIACFVLFNVYRNLKPALRIVLQGIPDPHLEKQIRTILSGYKTIQDVHDFHLWSLDGEHNVVSMHITVGENISIKDAEHLKEQIKLDLQSLHVLHSTIEVEYKPHCHS